MTNEKKEVDFVDITVPLNYDLKTTYASKANKHVELAEERNQTLKLKQVHTPSVIISTTGIIP
jgi:hypothetical protein